MADPPPPGAEDEEPLPPGAEGGDAAYAGQGYTGGGADTASAAPGGSTAVAAGGASASAQAADPYAGYAAYDPNAAGYDYSAYWAQYGYQQAGYYPGMYQALSWVQAFKDPRRPSVQHTLKLSLSAWSPLHNERFTEGIWKDRLHVRDCEDTTQAASWHHTRLPSFCFR